MQVGFLDLPGIHKPQHKMNRRMMRSVNLGLEDADVIFHFLDVTSPVGKGDLFVRDLLKEKALPIILVVNKMDLVNKSKALPILDKMYQEFEPLEMVPISAHKGENIERLMEIAATYLPEGEMLFDEETLTDQPVRFMAAELIREKILHYTREELPHVAAVQMESFQHDEVEKSYQLSAVVWVEKPTQRKIILGNQGSMISKITTGARRSLKELLQAPVSLELWVKVKERWRENEKLIGVIDFN